MYPTNMIIEEHHSHCYWLVSDYKIGAHIIAIFIISSRVQGPSKMLMEDDVFIYVKYV